MTQRIAGIDEAGRGPLAGPVVVAAVVFPPGRTPVNGLDDSKALTARKRELLYPRIIERALYPLLIASQTIPMVVLAPLFLIWFGYGLLPKVLVTALVAYYRKVDTLNSTLGSRRALL